MGLAHHVALDALKWSNDVQDVTLHQPLEDLQINAISSAVTFQKRNVHRRLSGPCLCIYMQVLSLPGLALWLSYEKDMFSLAVRGPGIYDAQTNPASDWEHVTMHAVEGFSRLER